MLDQPGFKQEAEKELVSCLKMTAGVLEEQPQAPAWFFHHSLPFDGHHMEEHLRSDFDKAAQSISHHGSKHTTSTGGGHAASSFQESGVAATGKTSLKHQPELSDNQTRNSSHGFLCAAASHEASERSPLLGLETEEKHPECFPMVPWL